jgi:NADP-dependent 3-hydroxy acid dehydrogenase YdfG
MTYRCAVITGASSGIGRAIALKMGQENLSVGILARRHDKLEEVAAEIKAVNSKAKVFPFQGDVRDKNSVKVFLDEAENSLGEVDIFVNNAGVGFNESFTSLSPEQVEGMLETNFSGSVWSIYHAMKLFEKRKRGVLVNISSTTVLKASSTVPLYAATKLGIHGLVRALEEEHLTNPDMKMINITPGPTLTGIIQGPIAKADEKNLISPDDIAHWMWLAINSPKSCKVSNLVLRNSGTF